jgi:NADH-quinone oxidoreductase subunit A
VSALWQYALLLGMAVATVGLVLCLGAIAGSLGKRKEEGAKDVPAASGKLSPEPVWVRYHARYYGYALLFLAFDMEMAYMYPWAVVYKELGLVALLDMGVFLAILFLGLLYGWSQGALRRQ